jgi:hypothetical protein
LDLATRWTAPAAGTPVYNAIKMFRNYDGNRSTFGDSSINAATTNPDALSVFAAVRSTDGAMTVMAINKQIGIGAALAINLTNFQFSGVAQAWQLTSSNSISRLAGIALSGSTLATTVPAQSITLFVLPASAMSAAPSLQPGSVSTTSSFDLWVNGQSGQSYVLQSTTDFINWSSVQTNTLTSNSWHVVVPIIRNQTTFYRARQ